MSRFLSAFLVAARIVSGQIYTISTSTTTAPVTTSTSVIPTAVETSSIISIPTLSSPATLVTDTSYYCVPSPTSVIANGPFITIFNTFYIDICSTGITTVTYAITDTCACQHASDYTPPTGCPTGFSVTEKTCTACPGMLVITVTTPIGPSATGAVPLVNVITGGVIPTSNPNPNLNIISNGNSSSSSITKPKPSYFASGAMPAASDSMLGPLLAMMMALVAGLMYVL